MTDTNDAVDTVTETIRRINVHLDRAEVPRAPSKAHLMSGGYPADGRDTAPGGFLKAVWQAGSRQHDEQAIGKAKLEELSRYIDADHVSAKATLGTTAASGGWIVPAGPKDELTKAAQYENPYRALCSPITGVASATVDVPYRSAAPARAVIALAGAVKQNTDLTYAGVTATMYTLARIHDVSNAFLRQSAGAAERDVMSELGHALALGEAYYILNGTGTNEPYGVIPAFTGAPAEFTTTFAAPSNSTVAGSVLAAVAAATGALAARNRTMGLTAVVGATTYGTMLAQGSDTAGFWLSGISGSQSLPGFRPGTLVTPWGIPLIADSTITDKSMLVGDWKALKLYFGDDYRVDTSSEAGDRWDRNLTGFRGEEEMGLDARPAVLAGAFQRVATVVP